MKAKALWVLKYLIVPFGFVWATGIISGFITMQQEVNSEKKRDPYSNFTNEEKSTSYLNPSNFIFKTDSLIKVRTAQVAKFKYYEPYEYFADLKQILMFHDIYRDSIEHHRDNLKLVWYINHTKAELMGLRDKTWRETNGYEWIGKAQVKEKRVGIKKMTITEAREYWFPLEKVQRIAKEQHPTDWKTDVLVPILQWMFHFYTKGLIFAFILFILWRRKLHTEFNIQTGIVSFCICVLTWPIILGIDLRNRANELLGYAEVVARRKKMFSLLSEQEKQLLHLAKTMRLREFKAHLDGLGMQRNHCLASALIMTVFLIIVPQSVFPHIETDIVKKDSVSIVESDYGEHDELSSSSMVKISALQPEILTAPDEVLLLVFYRFQAFTWLYFCDFIPDIGNVPKVSNRFVMKSI